MLKLKKADLVKIILEDKPTTIYRHYKNNEEKAIDILILMLLKFQSFYNCKREMNKDQLTELAYLITEEYRHLNYIDLAYCFKRVKAEKKIYDRIDGGLVMEWIKEHDAGRAAAVILERQKQKVKQNSEWSALSERSSVQKLKQFLKKEI